MKPELEEETKNDTTQKIELEKTKEDNDVVSEDLERCFILGYN